MSTSRDSTVISPEYRSVGQVQGVQWTRHDGWNVVKQFALSLPKQKSVLTLIFCFHLFQNAMFATAESVPKAPPGPIYRAKVKHVPMPAPGALAAMIRAPLPMAGPAPIPMPLALAFPMPAPGHIAIPIASPVAMPAPGPIVMPLGAPQPVPIPLPGRAGALPPIPPEKQITTGVIGILAMICIGGLVFFGCCLLAGVAVIVYLCERDGPAQEAESEEEEEESSVSNSEELESRGSTRTLQPKVKVKHWLAGQTPTAEKRKAIWKAVVEQKTKTIKTNKSSNIGVEVKIGSSTARSGDKKSIGRKAIDARNQDKADGKEAKSLRGKVTEKNKLQKKLGKDNQRKRVKLPGDKISDTKILRVGNVQLGAKGDGDYGRQKDKGNGEKKRRGYDGDIGDKNPTMKTKEVDKKAQPKLPDSKISDTKATGTGNGQQNGGQDDGKYGLPRGESHSGESHSGGDGPKIANKQRKGDEQLDKESRDKSKSTTFDGKTSTNDEKTSTFEGKNSTAENDDKKATDKGEKKEEKEKDKEPEKTADTSLPSVKPSVEDISQTTTESEKEDEKLTEQKKEEKPKDEPKTLLPLPPKAPPPKLPSTANPVALPKVQKQIEAEPPLRRYVPPPLEKIKEQQSRMTKPPPPPFRFASAHREFLDSKTPSYSSRSEISPKSTVTRPPSTALPSYFQSVLPIGNHPMDKFAPKNVPPPPAPKVVTPKPAEPGKQPKTPVSQISSSSAGSQKKDPAPLYGKPPEPRPPSLPFVAPSPTPSKENISEKKLQEKTGNSKPQPKISTPRPPNLPYAAPSPVPGKGKTDEKKTPEKMSAEKPRPPDLPYAAPIGVKESTPKKPPSQEKIGQSKPLPPSLPFVAPSAGPSKEKIEKKPSQEKIPAEKPRPPDLPFMVPNPPAQEKRPH